MPPPLKPVIDAFSASARSVLEADGWRKRRGDIYTLGDGDFLGWLGLNRATKYAPMKVNPVVGVRHQPTELTVAQLLGESPHAYLPPTISSPIGYLRPESKYCELTVESPGDADRAAGELGELLRAYAVPFIQQHSTTTALAAALRRRLTANPPEYRAPIAVALSGDLEAARSEIEAALEARTTRFDAEAERYRAFARAAQTWLDKLSNRDSQEG